MRILLDTNILILRENNHIIPSNISTLMSLLNGLENCSIHVHPLSKTEIQKDGNVERRNINLSKISSYSVLDAFPDYKSNVEFSNKIGEVKTPNDRIDNQLLYCAYINVVDYLVTEDQGLLNKAELLCLENVVNVNEAINIFEQFYPKTNVNLIQSFIIDKAFNFNLNDDIFDSLKKEYSEFPSWWKKISSRDVYAYKSDEGKINALLIPKIEINETVESNPPLKFNRVLKICLFKVASRAQGLKLGERLLKIAFDYARLNNIEDIYLTHFCQEKDYLVYLLEQFGFCKYGNNPRGEAIFIKSIVKKDSETSLDITYLNKQYYPSFCSKIPVRKHLVPIQPIFHKKLFPEYTLNSQQMSFFRDTPSEGNSIKKAYICNANTTKVNKNDILLFYRTQDIMSVTSLGIVDAVYYKQRNPEEILKLIAKRTVFSRDEIAKLCESDVLVILFKLNFHLKNDFSYNDLCKNKIVSGPIQTITEIDDDKKYQKIITGNINERFIIN